jgi:hypothetical protein
MELKGRWDNGESLDPLMLRRTCQMPHLSSPAGGRI